MLELAGITKRFGAFTANDAIDLSVCKGEIVALLGENGAGKTTLMNILFGHYRADEGVIRVFDKPLVGHTPDDALKAGVGMVHQHFTLADNLSVLDNILLGTESLWKPFSRRGAARQRLETIAGDAGLSIRLDDRVRDLTVGQRQRVEILKALYRDVQILILDEPTAVLTPQEVDDLFILLRKMASRGLSIIIISHKLQEVLAISERVVVLRHGQVVGEAKTSEVDRNELARMIVGRQIARPIAQPREAGNARLTLQNVCVRDTVTQRKLLDNIDLTLPAGQIIGLAGVSGNGQVALADVLSGLRAMDEGTMQIDGEPLSRANPRRLTRLGIARIPEDRQRYGVVGELTLWENLMLDDIGDRPNWRAGLVLDREAAQSRAKALIEQFDVRCTGADQPAALLSGGNMQKLILARNLARQPRIILANQPTRGLDEGAIASVHSLLLEARERGVAILLISEDLDEILRLSDSIVVMHAGHISAPRPAAEMTQAELGLAMAGADSQGASH